jgi:hypothetical protein
VAGTSEGCSESDLEESGDDQRNIMIFAEPDMDRIAGEVRSIAAEECSLRVESATGENPASVSPPGAVVRGVGIAFLIGVLMVDAVSGDPEDGSAFEGEATARGDEVFNPLGSFVATVGEQAMVCRADTDIDGEEVHDEEDSQIRPGEEEEGCDGTDVEEAHGDGGDPVNTALLVFTAHAEILLYLLGNFGDCRDDVKLRLGLGNFLRREGGRCHGCVFPSTACCLNC